jgi:putative hemolysin
MNVPQVRQPNRLELKKPLLPIHSSTQVTAQGEVANAGLANPASVHCIEQGYIQQMLEDEKGNQYGVCIFPDGSQYEEWAFFRGECAPAGEE